MLFISEKVISCIISLKVKQNKWFLEIEEKFNTQHTIKVLNNIMKEKPLKYFFF